MKHHFTALLCPGILLAGAMTLQAGNVTAPFAVSSANMVSRPNFAPAPEGETISLSRSCKSYSYQFGFVIPTNNAGSVASFVVTADGEYYLVNPVSEMHCDPIKGDVTDGLLTFTLPQAVRHVSISEDGSAEEYDVFATVLTEQTVDEEGTVTWMPAENQEISFTVGEDGSYTVTDSNLMLGLCMEVEGAGLQWLGFGDLNVKFEPMTDSQVVVPENLVTENYVVTNDDAPFIARMGFDGSDVYLQGLMSALPDYWIKGTIDGETISFPNSQYLGIARTANMYENYAYCTVVKTHYEGWDIVYDDPEPFFTATYDKETGNVTFATDDTFGINVDADGLMLRSMMSMVNMEYRGVFEPTTPPDPVVDYYDPYNEESGYGEIDFTMPDYGADGKVLDYNNYFYTLIVDGELYEVLPGVYPNITESMVYIPYSFTENNDIYSYPGGYHMFYFRIPEYKSIALQSIYTIDGVVNKSQVVAVAGEVGVKGVESASPVVSREYFDISGRRVDASVRGVSIIRETRADGSVTTRKAIR